MTTAIPINFIEENNTFSGPTLSVPASRSLKISALPNTYAGIYKADRQIIFAPNSIVFPLGTGLCG